MSIPEQVILFVTAVALGVAGLVFIGSDRIELLEKAHGSLLVRIGPEIVLIAGVAVFSIFQPINLTMETLWGMNCVFAIVSAQQFKFQQTRLALAVRIYCGIIAFISVGLLSVYLHLGRSLF